MFENKIKVWLCDSNSVFSCLVLVGMWPSKRVKSDYLPHSLWERRSIHIFFQRTYNEVKANDRCLNLRHDSFFPFTEPLPVVTNRFGSCFTLVFVKFWCPPASNSYIFKISLQFMWKKIKSPLTQSQDKPHI